MKRGLKVSGGAPTLFSRSGYNRFPDEKGTERVLPLPRNLRHPDGYNRFPDEKGTERATLGRCNEDGLVTIVSPMKRGLKGRSSVFALRILTCYNRFPDEKGTESEPACPNPKTIRLVTIVSPMKRGLKAYPEISLRCLRRSLQSFPR